MPGKPLIIGIAGGSGSGKTYILNKLIHTYPDPAICLISQDHYYRPLQEHPLDKNGHVNWDMPECINEDHLLKDIQLLNSGIPVEKWEYTFNHPELEPSLMILNPAPVLVIEGLFIFNMRSVAPLLDIKIFIESDEALCLERRIDRDTRERFLTIEQVLYQWENHVKPAYNDYLLPYKSIADITISNTREEPDMEPLYILINNKLESSKD